MNNKQALAVIKAQCLTAVKSGQLIANDRISVRFGDTAWITRRDSKLISLKERDLLTMPVKEKVSYGDEIADIHALLYKKYKRLGAIVNSSTPYSLSVSRTGETVRPYVDDIAQMVGIDIKCVEIKNSDRIISLLKRRSAVLIKDSGIMSADISLDDALASAMITEKGCRIHIQSRYLGGAKPINMIESALMRFIYLKKYSKIKY